MYVDGYLVMSAEWDGIVSHLISHKNIATAKETFKNQLNKQVHFMKVG